MSASASGNDASKGSARRTHNQGNQDRTYTPDQERAVLRIRRCKVTAFYDILGLEEVRKTCTDTEIKKAYRKQSLLTHPDKNGHSQADEAFKMVSRAFGVLGNKEKRDHYDRFGTDPDSRFQSAGQGPSNPFSGFASRAQGGGGMGGGGGGGQGMWGEDEMTPEEMFARFFGGGGGGFGGPFGGGPQFVFNFGGGPGVRVHQFGGARPRTRPRNGEQPQQEASMLSTLLGLLPILLLFILPLLTSIFSGTTSQPAMPRMVFDNPQPPKYTHERVLKNIGVKYYVDPHEISSFTDYKLHQMDKTAEVYLVRQLRNDCENELAHKQRLREAAQGWFFQDPDKMDAANRYEMPSCKRLNKLGVVV